MSAEKPEHGICRLDLEASGTYGWQVRLQRTGVRFARFFADPSRAQAYLGFEAPRDLDDMCLTSWN